MKYEMKSKGTVATLNDNGGALVEVSGRRRISGGIVVDVRVLDLACWTHGVSSWVEPEANLTYEN